LLIDAGSPDAPELERFSFFGRVYVYGVIDGEAVEKRQGGGYQHLKQMVLI
jgi:hypothetical protein